MKKNNMFVKRAWSTDNIVSPVDSLQRGDWDLSVGMHVPSNIKNIVVLPKLIGRGVKSDFWKTQADLFKKTWFKTTGQILSDDDLANLSPSNPIVSGILDQSGVTPRYRSVVLSQMQSASAGQRPSYKDTVNAALSGYGTPDDTIVPDKLDPLFEFKTNPNADTAQNLSQAVKKDPLYYSRFNSREFPLRLWPEGTEDVTQLQRNASKIPTEGRTSDNLFSSIMGSSEPIENKKQTLQDIIQGFADAKVTTNGNSTPHAYALQRSDGTVDIAGLLQDRGLPFDDINTPQRTGALIGALMGNPDSPDLAQAYTRRSPAYAEVFPTSDDKFVSLSRLFGQGGEFENPYTMSLYSGDVPKGTALFPSGVTEIPGTTLQSAVKAVDRGNSAAESLVNIDSWLKANNNISNNGLYNSIESIYGLQGLTDEQKVENIQKILGSYADALWNPQSSASGVNKPTAFTGHPYVESVPSGELTSFTQNLIKDLSKSPDELQVLNDTLNVNRANQVMSHHNPLAQQLVELGMPVGTPGLDVNGLGTDTAPNGYLNRAINSIRKRVYDGLLKENPALLSELVTGTKGDSYVGDYTDFITSLYNKNNPLFHGPNTRELLRELAGTKTVQNILQPNLPSEVRDPWLQTLFTTQDAANELLPDYIESATDNPLSMNLSRIQKGAIRPDNSSDLYNYATSGTSDVNSLNHSLSPFIRNGREQETRALLELLNDYDTAGTAQNADILRNGALSAIQDNSVKQAIEQADDVRGAIVNRIRDNFEIPEGAVTNPYRSTVTRGYTQTPNVNTRAILNTKNDTSLYMYPWLKRGYDPAEVYALATAAAGPQSQLEALADPAILRPVTQDNASIPYYPVKPGGRFSKFWNGAARILNSPVVRVGSEILNGVGTLANGYNLVQGATADSSYFDDGSTWEPEKNRWFDPYYGIVPNAISGAGGAMGTAGWLLGSPVLASAGAATGAGWLATSVLSGGSKGYNKTLAESIPGFSGKLSPEESAEARQLASADPLLFNQMRQKAIENAPKGGSGEEYLNPYMYPLDVQNRMSGGFGRALENVGWGLRGGSWGRGGQPMAGWEYVVNPVGGMLEQVGKSIQDASTIELKDRYQVDTPDYIKYNRAAQEPVTWYLNPQESPSGRLEEMVYTLYPGQKLPQFVAERMLPDYDPRGLHLTPFHPDYKENVESTESAEPLSWKSDMSPAEKTQMFDSLRGADGSYHPEDPRRYSSQGQLMDIPLRIVPDTSRSDSAKSPSTKKLFKEPVYGPQKDDYRKTINSSDFMTPTNLTNMLDYALKPGKHF